MFEWCFSRVPAYVGASLPAASTAFVAEAVESSGADHWDCRSSGAYAISMSSTSRKYGFRGCFHEVRMNELVVQTFTFEGMPDGVALEGLILEDIGNGRTRTTATSLVDSFAERGAIVASGMEHGVREGSLRFDRVLDGIV